MRRTSAVLALAVMAITPIACGSSGGGGTDVSVASGCTPAGTFTPTKKDTFTVVTSLPGPGFWEGSDSDPGKLKSGYEYDIAVEMAKSLCLKKMVVRNESFDAIVAGSVTKFDLALSQASITDKRKQVVDFTDVYFESNQGILVKKGKAVPDVAAAKKLKWGVQTGTTAIDLLAKLKTDSEPQVFQQLADAYAALDSGQVDAILIDTAINLGEAARSQGKFEVVAQFAQDGGPDQYGGIVPKNSPNLQAINNVLNKLKTDGTLKALVTKDLTADPGNIPTFTIS